MLTLDRPQDANSTPGVVARKVRIRVRPDGPVVELPLGKSTVGSSPRCNVRIQQPGVQPLHCLILNEASGLTVRRWAGETVLNGQRVEEAAIGDGDCLRVGPVELEIVEPQSAEPPPAMRNAAATEHELPPAVVAAPLAAAPPAPVQPMLDPIITSVAIASKQTESNRYRVGREIARSRGRKMLAAVREHREAGRELQQRIAGLERDLERAAADRSDFAGQLQSLASELAEARRKVAEQQTSALAYQDLASQNEQLGREVCAMIQRIEQLTNELTETTRALQTATAEKDSLAAETRRSADENAQLHAQLQQHSNRCSDLAAERDEARGQNESLRTELRATQERESISAAKADRLERELSALQQHAAELANQNSVLCGERDEAWRQCESLRSNSQAYSEREAAFAHSVARLEHENLQLQQQVADLSSQVTALSGERDEAWRQCESLRSNTQTLSERESALAQTVARLEYETSQQQQQVADLTSQVAALCGERDDARQQCEVLRSNVHALSERESSLAQTVERFEQESSQQQQQVADLTNRLAALCGERDDARQQCEALRLNVHALGERESSLAQTVARFEHEASQHRQTAIELSDQVATACAERDEAWHQCEVLRGKVRALTGRDDERTSEIAVLSGERDEAWQQCELLRSEVQSLQDRETALSQAIGRLEHENRGLRSQGSELSDHTALLSNERDEARRQCEALRAEVQALTERESALAENVRRFEQEFSQRAASNEDLTSQIGALRAEYDDLRDQNEQLRSQVESFAQERAILAEQQAAVNRECESLRSQLNEATSVETRQSEHLAEFVAECRRLREETDRLPQLEQQVRDAVADRENTSSELYRALLQLAEMQERDDHHAALEAAYKAVNAELEKSLQDIATLQSQIDRLSEQRIAEDATRESLDRRTAELIEAHQQLAYDKSTLTAELTELREQLELAGRRESELAVKLETAETSRKRLVESEQLLTELTETIAALRDELNVKASVEANAAAEIAERDRQIAEHARLLSDSNEAIRLLQGKVADANEVETQFQQARDEWRRDREETERRHSQLLQRIGELETQLAEAQDAILGARPATDPEAQVAFEKAQDQWRQEREALQLEQSRLLQRASQLESDLAEALAAADQATQLAADQLDAMRASAPAVSDWSSRGDDGNTKPPSTRNSANAIEIHDDFGGESTTLQTRATGDENPFAKVESGSSIQSPWSFTSSSAQTGGEDGCANDAWALTESQDSAAASWSCTAPVIQSSPDDTAAWQYTEPTNADADKTPAGPATASTSKAQPASFIERYSHMFADVAADDEPQPPPKDASTTDMEAESRRASGPVPPATDATTAEGEEESIEQYMAKLLQRVRGDLPATTAAVPTEGDRPITAPKNFTAPLTAPSATANGSGDLLSPIGFDASKRKSSLPTPQTDLEALRALANESARRAISRHAVRKHRRTLITKIIVSTLAGVTSLWLLLESERWLNLQSITACVSMLVAAYWAAETVRTLLNSLRVSTSDETDHEIEELSAKLRSPLPIDLEGSRAWTTQPLNASSNEAPAERTLAESELKVES